MARFRSVFAKGLKDFYAISVRENSAVSLVKELSGRDCIVLLDPTMTVEASQWRSICKPVKSLRKKTFILKYVLGDFNAGITDCIEQIQSEHKEQVRIVDLMDEKSNYFATGPDEFLWMIENAAAVLTDSFHATVFSILFQKPFMVFRRKGEDGETFGRLDTLLSQFHLENRVYGKSDCSPLEMPNFAHSKEILRREKDRTYSFLKNALES